MALTAYQTAVTNLIQAPSSPTPLISSAQLTTYINQARVQTAMDSECIRASGTLALTIGVQSYPFSAIILPGTTGVSSVITVRSAYLGVNPLDIRSWEWFAQYYLPLTGTGTPVRLAQHKQGVSGTVNFSPTPNAVVTVNFDVVCLPTNLADDTTVEAIPYPWTDAVEFYAGWLALQQLQRQQQAELMLQRYHLLIHRGRAGATATELPVNLPGGVGTALAAIKTTLGSPPPLGRPNEPR